MKRITLATFIILFSSCFYTANAQFPIGGPYQSIASPTSIYMPLVGDTVTDYSGPSPIAITRITDYYQPWDWYPTHEYAKTQVWNADQSYYRIRTWKVYDANNHQEVQDLSGSIYPTYWSNTDPDLIWSFKENGDIKKHFISTNTEQIVAAITTQAGTAYQYVKLGPGEGNIDNNDHYVALVGKDGLDLDVIVYDLQTLQIVHRRKFIGCWQNGGSSFPNYIDWVSVSQSGAHVVIMWNHNTTSIGSPYIENGNSHYGVEVYNTTNMQFQNRIIHYGNHGDLGYAVDGDEVLVQFYGQYGGGTLYMHKLDGAGSTALTTDSDFGVYGHVSCRNINRPGWAYITHSLAAQSGQIIAVKLDNSGLVEHFGHHFSSGTSYAQAAMAVSSPDGDKICFKSDFGTGPSTSPSVAYSFFANLADTSSSTLDISSCYDYSSPSGNYTWDTSGTYMDTITNIAGYDSIMTINLTIQNNTASSISPVSCNNYTSPSGIYTWNTNGTYTDTISNTIGCDSIITINLTVNGVDISVTNNSPTLTANASGVFYQWINCNNGYSYIAGETNQSFTAFSNGSYAVEINNNGCIDTSVCFSIIGLGIDGINKNNVILTPNPNNGIFQLKNLTKNSIIEIYSIDGKSIINTRNHNTKTLNLKLDYLENGTYFVKTINENIIFIIE